ncbi:MAG: CoA-binding protein [Candidatus Diapherotrites archaeon]|jgi:uncharacterized protein|nr:CoA-binding protein [Candidatus Diapherotrites archaeon]MBT4597364.1 CoA-binding protein [Candidatus Diapherotrites archaeon]
MKEIYAVVGASNNKEKYGYKVTLSLKELDENVLPINPHEKEILGLEVFSSLQDASESGKKIGIVVFVVPRAVTRQVLEEVKSLGIKHVWLQPGSESEDAISFCRKNGIDCVFNRCIMVEKGNVK